MRLFVAFEVPEAQKRSVEKAVQPLRLTLPGARFTPRESWHVTLKFLGEVPEARLGKVTDIAERTAAQVPASSARIAGLGVFPSPRRARVIWVGVEDLGGRLSGLAAALERRYGRAGFREEGRAWHPHLTLARIRVPGPIEEALAGVGDLRVDETPFPVSEVVLFRSRLSPAGSSYEALARLPLGAGR